jgi:hypothetical protein
MNPNEAWEAWAAMAPDWDAFWRDMPLTLALKRDGCEYEIEALVMEMRVDPPRFEYHDAGDVRVRGLLDPPTLHLTLKPKAKRPSPSIAASG